MDEDGNFIVIHNTNIKFLSPEGKLFHEIVNDELEGAYDIVTYRGKVIVSCSDGYMRIYWLYSSVCGFISYLSKTVYLLF